MNKPLSFSQVIGYLIFAALIFALVFSGALVPEEKEPSKLALDRDGNPIPVYKFEAFVREDKLLRQVCRDQGYSPRVCELASRKLEAERLNR